MPAGKISYGAFTPGALDIIGGGTSTPRTIKLWDNVIVNNNLSVQSLTVNGTPVTGGGGASSFTPSYQYPSLGAGWNPADVTEGGPPKYYVDPTGRVVLSGGVRDGVANTAIFFVPSNLAPRLRQNAAVGRNAGLNPISLRVNPDGAIFSLLASTNTVNLTFSWHPSD